MRYQVLAQLLAAAALLTAAGTPKLLRAQDAPEAPERGVARISIMNGDVSVRRGDSGDWVAGVVNAPLMVEDRVATGAGARAEVQFDNANMVRLGANAEIRLAQLKPNHYVLQLAHGTVTFRVLRQSPAQVELDTPPVAVRPMQIGSYRTYVQEGGTTEITVRAGSAEIYTPKGSEKLQAGQTMLARGNPADPEFQVEAAIAYDSWDRWNDQRDRELLHSQSYRNVPQDVYGAEDLDQNGRWVDDPSYGQVWSPAEGPDWAPYQNGRWVWEDWYGWTWVSYDPWGWAPYHYGRWFYAPSNGWCWYPGGYGPHYWSPALVAFFGYGGGAGVGFGFGNIGWVALAPFETLHPWWGRGFYGVNRSVNITNVNITNVYRNARVVNGVAGVRAEDFNQGRFGNISRVSGTQIREAGLVRGQLPVAPGSANLRFTNRAAVNVPRSATSNVRFFSRNPVAPVQRVPFAEQQRAMQQVSRQAAAPAARSVAPRAPVSGNSGGTWRAVSPSSSQSSGWRRFGDPVQAAPRATSYQTSASGYRSEPTPSQGRAYGQPQSIRVAPTVVKERAAQSNRSGGGSGVRGGSAPHGGGGGGSHGGGHGR